MPIITLEFLTDCKSCTYDPTNQCLVASAAAGGANTYFKVLNGKWYTDRGNLGLPLADAFTASLLLDPTAQPTSGDSFKVGPIGGTHEYSLVTDTAANGGGPKAVLVG